MRVPQRGRRGFTLIELLVVIAIIGILSTLAVVALNSARQRSRDAKRVSDIRQIQTALELGYAEIGGYPSAPGGIVLGSPTTDVMCVNGSSVFQGDPIGCSTTLMGLVPANPTPNGADYTYTSASGSATYSIVFQLEGTTGMLGAGDNCANQNGIVAGTAC